MVFLNHIIAVTGTQRKQISAGLPILGNGKRVSLRPTAAIHRAVFGSWVVLTLQARFFKKQQVFQPVTPNFKVPFKGGSGDVKGHAFARSIGHFWGIAPDFQNTGVA